METFIHHFRLQAATTRHWPRVYFESDEGVRTREACALFSGAVVGHMFQTQGGYSSIPTLCMANNSQMWEVIGSILAYTIAVLSKFPLTCIYQVTCWGLLGLQGERRKMLF